MGLLYVWCMFLIFVYMRFYAEWGLQSHCLFCGLINHLVGIGLFHDVDHLEKLGMHMSVSAICREACIC